jgi:dUTP pyrophosphatase
LQEIKIKYLRDVEHITQYGDWIDLRAAEDVEMKKGEWKLIPLGFACELPYGYEAHILPRSSTFKRYHILIANGMGIIDHKYCGNFDEWMLSAYATEDTFIPKNDRICQFRIMQVQPPTVFIEVSELNNKDRGGFGSTGSK